MPIRRRARVGENLTVCDRTGFTRYASQTVKEWNGLRVWDRVFEERHPQDFLRGVKDDQSVPDARPRGSDRFSGDLTTLVNADALAGAYSITVENTGRFLAGDRIKIQLNNGDMHYTTVANIDSTTVFQFFDPLPDPASDGNLVINITALSGPNC